MAQAFLRYAPADDQRPDPFSDAVIRRASNARLDEIKLWAKPRLPAISEEEIRFALMQGMRAGGADGFRASVLLKELFFWPVDMELCQFVRDTCNGARVRAARRDPRLVDPHRPALPRPRQPQDRMDRG
jgi:hypothetical protein